MPHKRSRTGCLTCRQDGYKCDEERPVCRRCVRLGKTCPGYGLQLKWRPVNPQKARNTAPETLDSGDTTNAGPNTASKSSDGPSRRVVRRRDPWRPWSPADNQLETLPKDVSLLDRKLLHHWTTVLAAMVSMAPAPANNPFLTHLTPLVVESPILRSAVLSMAASHLSSLQQTDSSMDMVGRRHRLMAVSSLRSKVGAIDAEVSLATILMLQLTDRLFITADDSPADHLVGAKAVIQQQPGIWTDSTTGSFLLGVYLYQDVLASVTKGSSPLLDLEEGIMVEGLGDLSKLTAVVRVVGHISRMRQMEKSALVEYGTIMHEVISSLEEPDSREDDISQTVEAYRHAAFIYLYRVAYNIGAPHPLTLHHVGECLRLLSQVPTTSTMLSAHVWPVWTAGCESIEPTHRDFFRKRLDEMYHLRRLPSLRRVRYDMEEVWRVKDAQRESTGTDGIDCIKAILQNRQRTADLI